MLTPNLAAKPLTAKDYDHISHPGRLYNPQLSITAMLNRNESELSDLHTVGPALRKANVRLMPLDNFNSPGSRGRRLMEAAVPFFTEVRRARRCHLWRRCHERHGAATSGMALPRVAHALGKAPLGTAAVCGHAMAEPCSSPSPLPTMLVQHYNLMFPHHVYANVTKPPDEGCLKLAEFHMSMLARFCWQADLANADGAEYVVSPLEGRGRQAADALLVRRPVEGAGHVLQAWDCKAHEVVCGVL